MTPPTGLSHDYHSLNLLLECGVEEFDEEILFSVVLCVVEHRQDDVLHKPVGPVLRHLKDQLGEITWVGLKEVEQMLIGLQEEIEIISSDEVYMFI